MFEFTVSQPPASAAPPALERELAATTADIIRRALGRCWDQRSRSSGYPAQCFELYDYTLNKLALGDARRRTTNRTSGFTAYYRTVDAAVDADPFPLPAPGRYQEWVAELLARARRLHRQAIDAARYVGPNYATGPLNYHEPVVRRLLLQTMSGQAALQAVG